MESEIIYGNGMGGSNGTALISIVFSGGNPANTLIAECNPHNPLNCPKYNDGFENGCFQDIFNNPECPTDPADYRGCINYLFEKFGFLEGFGIAKALNQGKISLDEIGSLESRDGALV